MRSWNEEKVKKCEGEPSRRLFKSTMYSSSSKNYSVDSNLGLVCLLVCWLLKSKLHTESLHNTVVRSCYVEWDFVVTKSGSKLINKLQPPAVLLFAGTALFSVFVDEARPGLNL